VLAVVLEEERVRHVIWEFERPRWSARAATAVDRDVGDRTAPGPEVEVLEEDVGAIAGAQGERVGEVSARRMLEATERGPGRQLTARLVDPPVRHEPFLAQRRPP